MLPPAPAVGAVTNPYFVHYDHNEHFQGILMAQGQILTFMPSIQQKSFLKVNSQFSTLFVGYACCRRSKLSKSTLTFDRKLQFKQTSWPEDS